ncbi:hypothetical protein D3C86_1499240 [compost metagenome]
MGAILPGGAGGHHQRDEVLRARVGEAPPRRLVPADQLLVARRAVGIAERVVEPPVKGLGEAIGLRLIPEEGPQVVVAHAAAHDEHSLVPQGRERSPDGQVLGRIEVRLQGELHHRDVRLGVDQQKGDEDPVIQPARGILARFDPACGEQLAHPRGHLGRARGRVLEVVGVLREAVVIVEQLRLGGHVDHRTIDLPVTRDDEHRLGAHADLRGDAAQVVGHLVPEIGRRAGHGIHEEAGAAAVGDVQGRHAGRGARHGDSPPRRRL